MTPSRSRFALSRGGLGFGLEDITAPVNIWRGDKDRNVPGARFHQCLGEGRTLVVGRLAEFCEPATQDQADCRSSHRAARIWLSHSAPRWRPFGSRSSRSQRHVATIASTRSRQSRSRS